MGPDTIARFEAEKRHLTILKYPADWAKYHLGAGPIRNKQMLVEGKPDAVFCFHDDLERSKGTANMVSQYTKKTHPNLRIVHYNHSGTHEIV